MAITDPAFSELIKKIENHAGVAHKKPVSNLLTIFGGMNASNGLGDDCGYLPAEDGYLLFTADSIQDWLLNDPYFAGFCGINVVINDIYAMGGKPLGLVNTIHTAGEDRAWLNAVAAGMHDACSKFNVPLLGGHLTPDVGYRALSVSGVGRAPRSMLTTFGARTGDAVIAAYDLNGERQSTFPVWDSSTASDAEALQDKLNLMVQIAEEGMATGARDISNAGIIGTLGMLAEASGVAAEVDLETIPCPPDIRTEKWLFMYPSYGFILTVHPEKAAAVVDLFWNKELSAARIGTVRDGAGITIKQGTQKSTIFRSGIISGNGGM